MASAAFGFGAALAALAPGLPILLVGRAVQGLGVALMSPAAVRLLVAAFPAIAGALIASAGALGLATSFDQLRGQDHSWP